MLGREEEVEAEARNAEAAAAAAAAAGVEDVNRPRLLARSLKEGGGADIAAAEAEVAVGL